MSATMTRTSPAASTPTGSAALAKAQACAALHVQLTDSRSLAALYGTSLAFLAMTALRKLSFDMVKGTQFSYDKLVAALVELAAAGSATLADVIRTPQAQSSASLMKAVDDARKAGLALPAPVNDRSLIARRRSALQQLLADAPEVTVQDLASRTAMTAMSLAARAAVRNAQSTGVLPADKTAVTPVTPMTALANGQIILDTDDGDKDDDTHVPVSLIDADTVPAARI